MRTNTVIKPTQLTIAMDYDETLAVCIPHAVAFTNTDMSEYYNLKVYGTSPFGEVFENPEFVRTQPLIPGAVECVNTLRKMGCKVVFLTAVPMSMAAMRVKRIMDDFGANLNEIILTERKDLIRCDILVDDALHHINASIAKYPILFRRPWSTRVTGVLAVNNYQDLISFVKRILLRRTEIENPEILCLTGPHGSGKTALTKALKKYGYERPGIITTDASRNESIYEKVSEEKFRELAESDVFAVITSNVGYECGVLKEEISNILQSGKKVAISTDMCGANTMKVLYGNEKVAMLYVKRDRQEILNNILNEDVSNDEKILRIMSLDTEEKNEKLCDYTAWNDEPEHTAAEIAAMFGEK